MSVSAGNASHISGAFDARPEALRWGSSLLLILLLHLGIAYYLIAFHRITLKEPPPPPVPVLVDLAPAPPVQAPAPPPQPVTPPLPAKVLPLLPIPGSSSPAMPPQPVTPVLTEPLPPVPPSTPPSSLMSPPPPQPAPEMPQAPELPKQAGPDSIPMAPPPLLRPEVAPSHPAPKTAAQRSPQTADAGGLAAVGPTDPVILWRVSVLKRIRPFIHWPPSIPYWVTEAAPIIRVTIDRQGNVLQAEIARTSGYDAIDHEAHKIFKRAETLPPPPPEVLGNPVTFEMTVTFTQQPL